MLYSELSSAAQTAYAQLQDAALAEALSRTVAQIDGSFARKTVKGRIYWYFSFREGAAVRQIYVGPDSDRVRQLIALKAAAAGLSPIAPLARAYAAHGGATLTSKHLRVIRRISDYGFFRSGGVLVGTHAFSSYANMLGVKWRSGDRTMDVDLALPGQNVSIAFPDAPPIDLHDALTTFETGFLPTSTMGGDLGPTYSLKGDPDFQIDFLTTADRRGSGPRKMPKLPVTATPLKFMEYLLENPTQAVLLDDAGRYVVASIPNPLRYGVHKLIVNAERTVQFATKARKDLEQAAALFQYASAQDPEGLQEAWDAAFQRGAGWSSRLNSSLTALSRRWPLARLGVARDLRGTGLKVLGIPAA